MKPEELRSYKLDVDLMGGVVPISKAASSLAALIKRAKSARQPIIITQKGYPSAVIVDIELYTALCALAERQKGQEKSAEGQSAP